MTTLPPKPDDWPADLPWPEDIVAEVIDSFDWLERMAVEHDWPDRRNIRRILAPAVRRRLNERNSYTTVTVPPSANGAYVDAVTDRELARLRTADPGTRNTVLNDTALRLARLSPTQHRERLRDSLIEDCHLNGLVQDDGLRSVEATIESAFRAADEYGPAEVPEPTGPEPDVTELAAEQDWDRSGDLAANDDGPGWSQGAESPPGWHADDGATFILDQPRNIPPLWGEGEQVLWAEGESLMIAAGMGTGKTTLAGQLVRAQLGIGTGVVLDQPVATAAGPILYLAMDRPRQIARSLARQFTEADRDTLKAGLIVRSGPPIADLAESPKLLAHMAKHYGAAVVYVDSLKDAAVGLSDDKVGAAYNRARQMLLAEGGQLCELHHVVKRNPNGGPPSSIADVYGSTWLTNGTGSVVFLTGDPGDPIVGFRHLRQPSEVVGPFVLVHDQAAGVLSIDPDETVDLVVLAFDAEPHGLTAKAAAMAKFETREPTRGQVEQMRRELGKMAALGHLRQFDGRRGGSLESRTPTVWHPVHSPDSERCEPRDGDL